MPQLAPTRDPSSSGPTCPSGFSRLASSGQGQRPLDPKSPGQSAFPRRGHCGCCFSVPQASGAHRAPWPFPAPTTPSARACLHPRGGGGGALSISVCFCPRARAAGTGISDPHHTPLPEPLQLSEARTWAWNSGSSGTPQSLFPARHCLGPGEPGVTQCIRAGVSAGAHPASEAASAQVRSHAHTLAAHPVPRATLTPSDPSDVVPGALVRLFGEGRGEPSPYLDTPSPWASCRS